MIKKIIVLFNCIVLFSACQKRNASNDIYTMLISTYTDNNQSKGIYILEVNPAKAQTTTINTISNIANPSFTVNNGKEHIYAVSEVDNFNNGTQGAVYAFSLDDNYNTIRRDSITSGGKHPCHLYLASQEKIVSVANYSSGSVQFLALDAPKPLTVLATHHHTGHGPNPRQESPHAHFSGQHPLLPQFIYATDLGADKIVHYKITDKQIEMVDSTKLPAGSGPRYIAFHPKLPICYIINELRPSIQIATINTKTAALTLASSIALDTGTAVSFASSILIHPSKPILFALNRGENTLTAIRLDDKGMFTQEKNIISCGGDWPRSMALSPDGKYLFVANQKSDNISIFHIQDKKNQQAQTAMLTPLDLKINIPTPTHIDFLEE